MEWSGTGHHFHIPICLKLKKESTCICKGVKFLTFVTYALPLVAMSERPCEYRNIPLLLWNVSAEGDFREFFFFLQMRKLKSK